MMANKILKYFAILTVCIEGYNYVHWRKHGILLQSVSSIVRTLH